MLPSSALFTADSLPLNYSRKKFCSTASSRIQSWWQVGKVFINKNNSLLTFRLKFIFKSLKFMKIFKLNMTFMKIWIWFKITKSGNPFKLIWKKIAGQAFCRMDRFRTLWKKVVLLQNGLTYIKEWISLFHNQLYSML